MSAWTLGKASAAFPVGSHVYHRGTSIYAGVSTGEIVEKRGVRVVCRLDGETLAYRAEVISLAPRSP